MGWGLAAYAAGVVALTWAESRSTSWQGLLKPLLALGFVATGAYVLWTVEGAGVSGLDTVFGAYARLVLAGLVACAAGDILLLRKGTGAAFVAGMAAFGLGHALLAWAFLQLGDVGTIPIWLWPLWGLLLAFGLQALRGAERRLRPAIAVYVGLITFMVFAAGMTGTWLVWPALAFAVSDLFVAQNRFAAPESWHPLAITPLYFGAQMAFALSPLLLTL